MVNPAARGARLCDGSNQRVGDRDDGGASDRRLDALATGSAPVGDDRSVAQLGDRDSGEEELVALEQPDMSVEGRAAAGG